MYSIFCIEAKRYTVSLRVESRVLVLLIEEQNDPSNEKLCCENICYYLFVSECVQLKNLLWCWEKNIFIEDASHEFVVVKEVCWCLLVESKGVQQVKVCVVLDWLLAFVCIEPPGSKWESVKVMVRLLSYCNSERVSNESLC